MLHSSLNKSVVATYSTWQEKEAKLYLRALLENPEAFFEELRLYIDHFLFVCVFFVHLMVSHSLAGKAVTSTTYGIKVNSAQDEVCHL